jgi:hypothetical protein
LTVAAFDVREPVNVELKDIWGVLDAQSVTRALVLIDPDTKI